MQTITIPGIHGSGAEHWQTLWEKSDSSLTRFQPDDWNKPVLSNWIDALDAAIAASGEPPMLLAHSLGCLLVAHWAARSRRKVRGAVLVSVPDPDGEAFPEDARGFAGVPELPLPFPVVMIASGNDPYASIAYARQRAVGWDAELLEIGEAGHINGQSRLGAWEQGRMLVRAFQAGLRAAREGRDAR